MRASMAARRAASVSSVAKPLIHTLDTRDEPSSVASSSVLDPEAPSNYNYSQRRRSRAVLYQLSGHYGQTNDKKALNKKIHNKIPANVSSITY